MDPLSDQTISQHIEEYSKAQDKALKELREAKYLSYRLSDQTTSGTVSGTGQFQIQGLPFAPKNGITHVGSVIEYGGGVTFSGDGLVYVVGAGTGSNTILNLYQRNDAQAIQNANITGVGANTYFSFQISYPV